MLIFLQEPIFHEELANKYIDEVINCLKNPETIEEVKMLCKYHPQHRLDSSSLANSYP